MTSDTYTRERDGVTETIYLNHPNAIDFLSVKIKQERDTRTKNRLIKLVRRINLASLSGLELGGG